jgi:hypothetical protein
MARRKQGSLAVDRMTMEAIWAIVAKELSWFGEYGIRGAAFAEKRQHLDRLDACCAELALRGLQLTLGQAQLSDEIIEALNR